MAEYAPVGERLDGGEVKLSDWKELHSQGGERLTETLCQESRSGCIAMNAERIGFQVKPGTVGGMKAMAPDKLGGSPGDRRGLGDESARLAPGQQASLCV